MAETRHEGPRGPKKPKSTKKHSLVRTIKTISKEEYNKRFNKAYRESKPLAPTPFVLRSAKDTLLPYYKK